MDSVLRDQVNASMNLAGCEVVDTVMDLCQKTEDREQAREEQIENKASIFFGLAGGTSAFIANIVLNNPPVCRFWMFAMGLSALASFVSLFLALKPRVYSTISGGDLFASEVLDCSNVASWSVQPSIGTGIGGGSASPPGGLSHGDLHRLNYKKFMLEQYWDCINSNMKITNSKAKALKWGTVFYMMELVALLVFVASDKP